MLTFGNAHLHNRRGIGSMIEKGLYERALKKPGLFISGAAMFGGLFPLIKAANIGLKIDQLGPFMIGGAILGAATGTYFFCVQKSKTKAKKPCLDASASFYFLPPSSGLD